MSKLFDFAAAAQQRKADRIIAVAEDFAKSLGRTLVRINPGMTKGEVAVYVEAVASALLSWAGELRDNPDAVMGSDREA